MSKKDLISIELLGLICDNYSIQEKKKGLKMKTHNLTLITRFEYRDIEIEANSLQEAREKIARMDSEEIEKLTAEMPHVMGWKVDAEAT